MKILDKYILRNFIGTLIFALIAFCAIFIVVDLVGYLDKFIDKQIPKSLLFAYYFYYLPYIIALSFPVAMLLASLFSIGQMARYNEIVAMNSSGISINRILLPLLIFSLLISTIILYAGEKIVPLTNQKKINIYQQYVRKSDKRALTRQSDVYVQLSEKEWLNIGYFDTKINTGFKVTIQRYHDDYQSLKKRIDAPKIIWEHNKWILLDGIIREFDNQAEKISVFSTLERTDIRFKPEDLSFTQKKTEEMSYWELRQFIKNIKRNGGNPDRWLVDLYLKISFPFANFIIVLFGAPLASRKTRSGPAVSFGISLFICFLYFGIIKVAQALGHNGTLSPYLGAWLGNIIFGYAGIVILFIVRK